jgi:hypothetical protein
LGFERPGGSLYPSVVHDFLGFVGFIEFTRKEWQMVPMQSLLPHSSAAISAKNEDVIQAKVLAETANAG